MGGENFKGRATKSAPNWCANYRAIGFYADACISVYLYIHLTRIYMYVYTHLILCMFANYKYMGKIHLARKG